MSSGILLTQAKVLAFDSLAPARSPCWASRLCRSAPPAPFCETPIQNQLASGTDALQFGVTSPRDAVTNEDWFRSNQPNRRRFEGKL